jgi:hypothetical protein
MTCATHDLRLVLRVLHKRRPALSAANYDSHTLYSTPESCERAEHNGHKKRTDSKVHMAVACGR